MKKFQLLFIAFALFIPVACSVLAQTPPPEPTFSAPASNISGDCAAAHPTQVEIDQALQDHADYFPAPTWERSYTVFDVQIRVTWTSSDLGAVANFDYIIFCNVSESILDEYYVPSTLDIVMENYDEHELQKECRSGGQRLYEFKARKHGLDYHTKLWVEIVDSDHTIQSLLVFPMSDTTNMELYSRQIMPELPACP